MKRFLTAAIMAVAIICIGRYDVCAGEIQNQIVQLDTQENTDITEDLNAALMTAAQNSSAQYPVTVNIPAGEYTISGCIHIYSNTILDLTSGVTIKYSANASANQNMLLSGTNGKYKGQQDYNNSEECKEYNGFENITIKGGTWIGSVYNSSVLFRIAHAKNVTLDGVTFIGGGGLHQMEVAAIDGFYVRNCTFRDFDGAYENGKKMEALQLDIPCSTTTFKDFYLDGTILKNVEITGCNFENVPRGIGTHSMLIGAYHDGIKINNNKFKNIFEEAIICLGYKNCEINNNTFTDCAAGILFKFFNNNGSGMYTTVFDGMPYGRSAEYDANTVISGNVIQTVFSATCNEIVGIKVYGLNSGVALEGTDKSQIAANDYYISGVTVCDNSITTAGYGIRFLDTKNSIIRNNTIISSGVSEYDGNCEEYDGIQLSNGSTNINVDANPAISYFPRNGIYLRNGSSASSISSNAISGCLSNGISLYTDCAVNGISANTITNCLNSGIKASTRCSLGDISSNMITGVTNEAGVVVYNSSLSGLITQNTITTGNCYGIKASKNSVISAISANAFSDSKKNAIYVFGDSTVAGGITSNTITNVKTPINILSTSNDLLIDSNNISGAYSNVVVIDTKTNKSTVAIMNNSISGNKTSSGIWVKSGRFAAQGNTIQNVGKGIATQTSASGSIFENIFKSTVKTKMNLNGKTSYSFGYKKMAAKKLESRARGKCTISWNKYKYANQYEIQYSTRSDFSKDVKTIKAGKVRDNVTLSGLKSKKTYYVRIRAINVLNGVKVYNSYGTIKKIKM